MAPRLRRRLPGHRLVLASHRRQTQLLQAARQRRRHVLAHRSPPCSVPCPAHIGHYSDTMLPPRVHHRAANPPPAPTPGPPAPTVSHSPTAAAPPTRSKVGVVPAAV